MRCRSAPPFQLGSGVVDVVDACSRARDGHGAYWRTEAGGSSSGGIAIQGEHAARGAAATRNRSATGPGRESFRAATRIERGAWSLSGVDAGRWFGPVSAVRPRRNARLPELLEFSRRGRRKTLRFAPLLSGLERKGPWALTVAARGAGWSNGRRCACGRRGGGWFRRRDRVCSPATRRSDSRWTYDAAPTAKLRLASGVGGRTSEARRRAL